jgi:prolyl-tRNA synthetase
LWQEGHIAHATKEEAIEETYKMINVYADFAENYMAMPVIKGVKTANERFAGAIDTFCIEALMQDGKALQSGTSHFLGQNFAKAFDVKFANKEGKLDYVWATSWGVSTRLMGALVMAHSDDNGLVLPPNLAPIQVVFVPIYNKPEQLALIAETVLPLKKQLESKGLSVQFDDRDTCKPGFKFAEHELKGIPVRIAIGPRDLENKTIEVARRDTLEKQIIGIENAVDFVVNLLDTMQKSIYQKALKYREEHTSIADSYEEFKQILDNTGGFILAHWDGSAETELLIKEETKATIRCIPFENKLEPGKCIRTGKPSVQRVIFARAY